ncbi:hypothetical protein ABT104_03330 [Streptomyces mobaraensis]|uniref:hypothetical protein n=1 Tax=Streptomyces mobaraensis TaxID=35621 RepID=UPI00331CF01E
MNGTAAPKDTPVVGFIGLGDQGSPMAHAVAEAGFALAAQLGLDLLSLVDVLKLGSASSAVPSLLNTMVRTDNVEHLSSLEALDMELFDQAMRDADIEAGEATERSLSGARGLPALLTRLNG